MSGRSFQFGCTSTQRPRCPPFPHLTRRWHDGTATSSGYFDTSISA
jgi:hypothetical protein